MVADSLFRVVMMVLIGLHSMETHQLLVGHIQLLLMILIAISDRIRVHITGLLWTSKKYARSSKLFRKADTILCPPYLKKYLSFHGDKVATFTVG
jgi:hypothetical protein